MTNKESLNSEFLQDSEASQNQAKNTASYVENSDHLPRKKIYYNDSSLKTGGGGTGLMYGASDNSSSSSKKVEKKGSVSSNSAHSVNSNSEKSSQKQFDRLIERNKILDLYYFNNDQTDSENIQGISTPIKLLNNGEIKNYINEGQESYFENKNSDLEQSNVNYYQFEVSNSNLNRQSSNQNKSSEEKRLSKDQVDLTNDIIYYKKSFSENKSEANNLISDKSPAIFYKTPDKIIEFHVTSPESNKESEKDSPYYSGSSNITPNKHLETITEQPTNMEMDNTDWLRSSEQNSNQSNDIKQKNECFKTPSGKESKSISPHKIKLTDDHKSIVLFDSGRKSIIKLSSIKKSSFIRFSPDSKDDGEVEMLKLFTPSPEWDKKGKSNEEAPSPVKMYEQINQSESGAVQRHIGNECNIEFKNGNPNNSKSKLDKDKSNINAGKSKIDNFVYKIFLNHQINY